MIENEKNVQTSRIKILSILKFVGLFLRDFGYPFVVFVALLIVM